MSANGTRSMRSYWDSPAGKARRIPTTMPTEFCRSCKDGNHARNHDAVLGCLNVLPNDWVCACYVLGVKR